MRSLSRRSFSWKWLMVVGFASPLTYCALVRPVRGAWAGSYITRLRLPPNVKALATPVRSPCPELPIQSALRIEQCLCFFSCALLIYKNEEKTVEDMKRWADMLCQFMSNLESCNKSLCRFSWSISPASCMAVTSCITPHWLHWDIWWFICSHRKSMCLKLMNVSIWVYSGISRVTPEGSLCKWPQEMITASWSLFELPIAPIASRRSASWTTANSIEYSRFLPDSSSSSLNPGHEFEQPQYPCWSTSFSVIEEKGLLWGLGLGNNSFKARDWKKH